MALDSKLSCNGTASRETDITGSFSKEIFPKFALTVSETYINLNPKGGPAQDGWSPLDFSAKYQLWEVPEHEFILSIGSDFTLGGGYVACSKLPTGFSPTAIAAMNDIAAVGALRCATDCGVRVHDDLSAIGFDDITAAEFSQPALTTVGIPRDRIGVPAFQALREMPDSKSHEGAEYRVTPKLAIRESRGAARTEGR